MILYPNAKINLGLNILEKRIDSYHNISSVFYPLYDLYDILEIIPSKNFSFSSSGIKMSSKSNNICVEAFNLLKLHFNIPNVMIHLHKVIPIGGGLGGGSSDGSFVLKGINKLFDMGLSNNQLEKYALNLGADCPFFIDSTPKYVEGVGEKMRNIDLDLSNYRIEIKRSSIHVSTAEAYKYVVPQTPKIQLEKAINFPIQDWKNIIKNDFEESVFNLYPELLANKQYFYDKGAVYSSMTGTGSVVFGIFKR